MKQKQILTVLFCAVSTTFTVTAQTPPLLNVARVQVKPDKVGEYMDAEKQYSAAFKKGGGTLRVFYRSTAGNPFEFLMIAGEPNYAAHDDKSYYAKGATEADLVRMAARRAQCVDSVRLTYERAQPELGFSPPGTPQPKTVTVVRVNVHPDMIQQWMATVKNELVPAWKKAGQPGMLVRRVEYGGSRNQFTVRVPLNKWADLDGEGPLVKALGQDGAAKLGAKLSSMSNAEWLVYNYVPEMSVLPPQ